MPVRDAIETLDLAVWSILRQSEHRFELLAIDDGSRDGSRDRLSEWGARDPRLRVLSNPGRGLVAALNVGLEAARAPLVARMDADDIAARRRLERQRQWLSRRPEVSIVGSLVRLFPAALVAAGYRAYEHWINGVVSSEEIERALFVESPLPHPSVMFRRDPIRAIGAYREGSFPEDYELWLRAREQGLRMGKVAEPLLAWRDHPARTSRRSPRYTREAFAGLRAEFLGRELVRRNRPLIVWGAGRRARRFMRRLDRGGISLSCWIDIDPRKIGGRVLERPVLAPQEAIDTRHDELLLVLVTNHGAREEIGDWLRARGLREGDDFMHVGT